MPWYWTDEIARYLLSNGSIDSEKAAILMSMPVAPRSDEETVEDAAKELMDDDEIPLAA